MVLYKWIQLGLYSPTISKLFFSEFKRGFKRTAALTNGRGTPRGCLIIYRRFQTMDGNRKLTFLPLHSHLNKFKISRFSIYILPLLIEWFYYAPKKRLFDFRSPSRYDPSRKFSISLFTHHACIDSVFRFSENFTTLCVIYICKYWSKRNGT